MLRLLSNAAVVKPGGEDDLKDIEELFKRSTFNIGSKSEQENAVTPCTYWTCLSEWLRDFMNSS